MSQPFFQLGRALTVLGISLFVTCTLQSNSQAQTIANNNLLGTGGSSFATGDNPPPALLAKIQIATQATAPSGAISRSEVQPIGAISQEPITRAHRSEFGSLFVEDLYSVAMEMVWVDESLSWLWIIPNLQEQIASMTRK